MMQPVSRPAPSLLDLPDELIQHILSFVSWQALAACQLSSKRLHSLAQYPSLWRHHCLAEYRYWHPRHHLLHHLAAAPGQDGPWKRLLAARRRQDRAVLSTFNTVLDTQHGRFHNIQDIADTGYDAKEVLLDLSNAPDDADDVLARRYWALEALGCIERSAAIQEWEKLAKGEPVPLERALGAYDLFAAECPPLTLDQISAHLDLLAADFKDEHAAWSRLSPRQRAAALIEFLHGRNYMGISNRQYESLQNNFISVALSEADHPSLPLISVCIFCCVAQRLGVDAKPVGFPGHVHAVLPEIHPETGQREWVYLDPYASSAEVPVSRLRTQLEGYGIVSPTYQDSFLGPASTQELLMRVGRNITEHAHHPVRGREGDYCAVLATASPDVLRLLDLDDPAALYTAVDRHRALYAAYWAAVLLTASRGNPASGAAFPRNGAANIAGPLNELLALTEPRFLADLPLVTRHVVPLLGPGNIAAHVSGIISTAAADDATLPEPKRRRGPHPSVADAASVRYRVGQVFKHARYGYVAAITGWDTRCAAGEAWIARMAVDSLAGGRGQCFYNAVVEDESERYVAEENVVLLSDGGPGEVDGVVGLAGRQMPKKLARVAGRWFKRWDVQRGAFVSNVDEVYPDD